MSGSTASPAKKGWKAKLKKTAKLLGLLLVLGVTGWYLLPELWSTWLLHLKAIDIYRERQSQVNNAPSFADAARARNQAKAELDHNRSLIDQPWPPPVQTSVPSAPAPPLPAVNIATSIGDNKWEVVFTANLEFHTGIRPDVGHNVTFSGWTGATKLNPGDGYTNPPSGGYPTNQMKYKASNGDILVLPPERWLLPDAWTGALLAKVEGQDYTDVGGRVNDKLVVVSAGEIVLSVNSLKGERNNANGILRGIIEVQ